MTAHSAHSRSTDLFAQKIGDRLPSTAGTGDALCGWRGLSRAPLPVGEHVIDSVLAVHGLDFDPIAAGAARTFTTTVLRHWALDTLAQDAKLVASELVTNACLHAVPTAAGFLSEWSIQLGLVRRDSTVTCMVFDPSQRVPTMGDPRSFLEDGRGLRLIASFSSDWGWDILDGQGKVVWADITIPGRS